MCKSKPKTMRFDVEVEKIIQECKGNSFSEKFHNLVYDYKKYLPELTKRKNDLEQEIREQANTLHELQGTIYKYQLLVSNLDYVRKDIEDVIQSVVPGTDKSE